MKSKKRTTVTVETFEELVIQLKQPLPKVFCENCRKPITKLPISKIAFAQPVADSENIYLFVTDSGLCFFLEIL